MPSDDFRNQQNDVQSANQYISPNISPDAQGHIDPVENLDKKTHEDLAETGAGASSEATLHTDTGNTVTLPENNSADKINLPEKKPDLRKNSQGFGLYNVLKRKMEQRALKIKKGKIKGGDINGN